MTLDSLDVHSPLLSPVTSVSGSINNIAQLSISTDSVVAICTVRVDSAMKQIIVHWGDEQQTVLDHDPGTGGTAPLIPLLPQGSYEFVHVYDAPENGRQFERSVVVLVQDEQDVIDSDDLLILITPRYRIEVFPTSIRLLSACDFADIGNRDSEFTIKMKQEEGQLTWPWKPSNDWSPSPWLPLPGSHFSKEVTPNENEYGVYRNLVIIEHDPGPDTSAIARIGAAWLHNDRVHSYEVELSARLFGSCKVEVRYYHRSRVVANTPDGPQVVRRAVN